MRSANPALRADVFDIDGTHQHAMTVMGTTMKTGVLLALLVAAGGITWDLVATNQPLAWGIGIGGLIGGLVLALITIFNPKAAPFTSPLYAVAEGLFLGALSAVIDALYPGIVVQAVGLTFGVLATMLIAYATGVIRVTEKFRMGVVAATGAVFIVYIASMVLNMFGTSIPFIHSSGLIGIGFSVVVIVIAALNLALDFDFIESGVQSGAPKYMEWYAGFGLMVTLVWLYIEILHLLYKLQGRD
jgi:uncharacterized YccA/Bax inhibitor family protein